MGRLNGSETMTNCPSNCAIRKALRQLNPERQKELQTALVNQTMTVQELIKAFKFEAGATVYRNSVYRHRNHSMAQEQEIFTPVKKIDRSSVYSFLLDEV